MVLQDFIVLIKESIEESTVDLSRIEQFNNAVETIYTYYRKAYHREYEEKATIYLVDFETSADYEEFFYQWNYYPFDMVRSIYTHAGWKMDKEFLELEPVHNSEGDCLFYRIDFFDVYDKVRVKTKELPDSELAFFYCILILINGIDKNRELYHGFVHLIENALREYKLSELKNKVFDGKRQIFVAMSFAQDMRCARESIRKAISENGFLPRFIDEKEHSNFIVPEMLMEIEKSAFVVADLTHQRGGVYYEAGYAHACRIPVVMTCKSDDFDSIHFDIKQINTIKWNDEEELKTLLSKRIEALNSEQRNLTT